MLSHRSFFVVCGLALLAAPSAAQAPATPREQLAATFLQLPPKRQTALLDEKWPTVAGPDMLPALRVLVEPPAPPAVLDLAIRRLYELAPDEGRPRILREIANPSPGATLKTLGALPDRELPELDETLAANVESSRRFDALSIRAELLQRYASPAVRATVLAWFEDHVARMACRPQAALLAYFVRVDGESGTALLKRALDSRDTTGCYTSALPDVAAFHMSPAVEAVAVAALDDEDPQVVISAVETLGRLGSAAAAQPLKARFARWHRRWDGRADELGGGRLDDRPQGRQATLEVKLLEALGGGQTTNAELRELRKLCVTDTCRARADRMLVDAASRRK